MTNPTPNPITQTRRGTVPMMAVACGVMVANIYLCQPLLAEMTRSFGVSARAAGLVAVAAQIGYTLGILFLVPLADVADPRRLVRVLMAITTLGLLGAAVAPSLPALIFASAVIAAATVVPQVLIPFATTLVSPERRGRAIGSLQTGLILGILLSRTVSGMVTQFAGSWRASYLLAAILSGGLLLILPAFMPPRAFQQKQLSYVRLLSSLPALLAHGPLRTSIGLGFCLFGAFSAIWATMAFHLASQPFGLGPAAIGLFGLWGAPGAILSPLAGRWSDRIGPSRINLFAILFCAAAFAVAGILGGVSLIAMVVAVNLMDFGMQSSQVANQARIFALGTAIRGRLNTVYMVGAFAGGACGSLAGTVAWSFAGWTGVCALCGVLTAAAAGVLLASWREGKVARA